MARPHTMFIQNQALPWQEGVLPGARALASTRLLSLDAQTNALTAILRLPEGARVDDAKLKREEEWLILDGSLIVEGRELGHSGYVHRPAATTAKVVAGSHGVQLLLMLAAETNTVRQADEQTLVDPVADGLEGWTENPYTRYLMGTGVHPLREDKETGEVTFLYSALPYRFMAKRWSHPVVQEMFVLAGEYAINDVGLMTPGAYAWWNPNEWHGPYGSRTGFTMLIRSHGGALSNLIDDEIVPVDYAPIYKPQLPPEMLPYAKPPTSASLC